ncbi:hypothetical protein ACFL0I_03765 [Gemmatimonadota bacterium]
MRTKPHAFFKVGSRWINFALVTDVEDDGDSLTIFLASDMARLVGGADPTALDVARRITISDPAETKDIRMWLNMSDEN